GACDVAVSPEVAPCNDAVKANGTVQSNGDVLIDFSNMPSVTPHTVAPSLRARLASRVVDFGMLATLVVRTVADDYAESTASNYFDDSADSNDEYDHADSFDGSAL